MRRAWPRARQGKLGRASQITDFLFMRTICHGRGAGVGRDRGTGVNLGVVVAVGVGVVLAVAEGVAVSVDVEKPAFFLLGFAFSLQTGPPMHRRKLRAGRDAFGLGVVIDPPL